MTSSCIVHQLQRCAILQAAAKAHLDTAGRAYVRSTAVCVVSVHALDCVLASS